MNRKKSGMKKKPQNGGVTLPGARDVVTRILQVACETIFIDGKSRPRAYREDVLAALDILNVDITPEEALFIYRHRSRKGR